MYELNNNVHYTYNQLHSIFNQKVHSEIGARKSNVFPEVEYPKGLTKEKIERLYPIL